MVAKKAKATKKAKNLGARKVTAAKARNVKGGSATKAGKKSWID